ncbi:TIR domain-containing protein [Lentzea sp. BCCO 10_0856]|uniref:TIR domain-containing protein n=1 Tax=Lentzea miocenica TaxID=3095431 RepID=A0ABU4STP8_9PSEU|nr:TIR domain-containing protein [Lentzea sp. BCCO 10_0856]MDX8029281.1 TIR domain-containing protein [Lentzea sp. BCCO 10_0856]
MSFGPPGFFLSYTQADAAYVQRLAEHLEASALPVWLDAKLRWGARVPVEIRDRLSAAPGIIVIMSPASERSEWVEREILEGQRYGRPFLPILLRGQRHFLLASTSFFDARDGRLPGAREICDLRELLEGGPQVARPSPAVPVASVPAETSLRKLRHALEEGQLAHADILTTSLLLDAARRLDKGWLRRTDGANLPTGLLADIDALWSKFAQQGFAVQQARHPGPPPGAPPGRHRDFLALALSVGWKGLRGEVSPVYEELVAADFFPPGFFPTMRNPQLERFESWHDKWTDTVMAVHTRLRNSGVR